MMNQKKQKLAAKIYKAVMSELEGRSGFDAWLGCCDDEVRSEIRFDLKKVIYEALPTVFTSNDN